MNIQELRLNRIGDQLFDDIEYDKLVEDSENQKSEEELVTEAQRLCEHND